MKNLIHPQDAIFFPVFNPIDQYLMNFELVRGEWRQTGNFGLTSCLTKKRRQSDFPNHQMGLLVEFEFEEHPPSKEFESCCLTEPIYLSMGIFKIWSHYSSCNVGNYISKYAAYTWTGEKNGHQTEILSHVHFSDKKTQKFHRILFSFKVLDAICCNVAT